jgi:UDP-N-acetylmuramate--alanine ligase
MSDSDFAKTSFNIVSYPEFLGELSKNMYTIAISGTHGKTTTTAMIGHIMEKADLDPTIIVGSKMMGEDGKYSNFHAGKSKYLVVEACEYKRSFLNLSPTILVITNIEADHLDYYRDLEDIKSAFREIENKVLKDGFVIKEEEYNAVEENFKLVIPGKHNILNAKAAIKAVEKIGISNEKAKEFLKDFRGTWRRQEFKGENNDNIYYDDYAHHPTEIRATLKALKEKHPDRKLVAIFEPHQQSRTKLMLEEFAEALSIADFSFITPIFITREIDDGLTTNKTLAEKIKNGDTVNSPEEARRKISKLGKGLCIVLMGAGNIYQWTKTFNPKL